MSKFFVKTEQINNNDIVIIGDDVNHIINVLRMKKQTRYKFAIKIQVIIIMLKLLIILKMKSNVKL